MGTHAMIRLRLTCRITADLALIAGRGRSAEQSAAMCDIPFHSRGQ